MGQGTRAHRALLLLAALLAFWAAATVLPRTVALRDRYRLVSRPAEEGVPPEYIVTSALLGGFRGLFLTALWTRGQTLKNEGKFFEMVQTYNLITKLEPNYANAWAFAAWDLAFNVSVEFKENPADRVFWVFRGIELLRNQAIPLNRNVPELYHELAWIFHFKVGGETDFAHPLYRRVLAERMQYILLGPGEPQMLRAVLAVPAGREALLAEPAVADAASRLEEAGFDIEADARRLLRDPPEAARPLLEEEAVLEAVRRAFYRSAGARLREEMNMEPERMLLLQERYGPIDWRLPHAHALYWAWSGREVFRRQHPERNDLKYGRLVYFSLIKIVERGRLVVTEDGRVFALPDYGFLDAVVRHMDETLTYYRDWRGADGKTLNLVGVRAGYENFLRAAVFNAYFDGRHEQAERLLAKLVELTGKRKLYARGLETFVQSEFAEWIRSPGKDRAMNLLRGFLTRGYRYLALGDADNYRAQRRWAEFFFRNYVLKRWNPDPERVYRPGDEDYRYHVPRTLDTLRTEVLESILLGRTPGWDPLLARRLIAQLRLREPEVWEEMEKRFERLATERARRERRLEGDPAGPRPPMARPPEAEEEAEPAPLP